MELTPFLQLVLSLIVIIAGAKFGGLLANRLRQPAVLGELLVGLLLGPSVVNLLGQGILTNPDNPLLLHETIFELADLGVVCLMFLAGLEIELPEMFRGGRVLAKRPGAGQAQHTGDRAHAPPRR